MNLYYMPISEINRYLPPITEKIEKLKEYGHYNPESERIRNILIDSVYATMELDGWHLQKEHVASIATENFSRGPDSAVKLATNIMELYKSIDEFDPSDYETLLSVFSTLIKGNDISSKEFRSGDFFSVRNYRAKLPSPPANEVPLLICQLFEQIGLSHESPILRAIMAQYIFEFVQPFELYNGIMGRFWQMMVMNYIYPGIGIIPAEHYMLKYKFNYDTSLATSIINDDPSEFLGFMLKVLDAVLKNINIPMKRMRTASERIRNFHQLGKENFARKEYMKIHDTISTATASRDLDEGVRLGLFTRNGSKNKTLYSCVK